MHQPSVPVAIFSALTELLAKECDAEGVPAFWLIFSKLGYRLQMLLLATWWVNTVSYAIYRLKCLSIVCSLRLI
jgi:uncharacterized RDD family membrane protein YckC